MPDTLTVTSRDGKWKADMKAWKNYAIVYASIGSEVSVYHLQETTNVWGNKVTDWVATKVGISIQNIFKGTLGPGGMGNFTQSGIFNDSSAELKEWAVGLISISINVDNGDVSESPGSATLSIDSVEGHISVSIPGNPPLVGVVSASSIVSDNSIWG